MANDEHDVLPSDRPKRKLQWRDDPEITAKRKQLLDLERQRKEASAAGETKNATRLVTQMHEIYDSLGILGWGDFEE